MSRCIATFVAIFAWLGMPVVGVPAALSARADEDPPGVNLPPALAPESAPMAAEWGATMGAADRPGVGPTLDDFERWASERNPTLRQAAAQVEAARSRSLQAGLYPNPRIGYVGEQIGVPSELSGAGTFARTRTPGELQGGFVEQEIVTAGKLRLSRAKFAEEAEAARWRAAAQELRVRNGVGIRYFELLAAQRLLVLKRELSRVSDDAVETTVQLVNVGQANEPDLLQARVEARRAAVDVRNAERSYRGAWQRLAAIAGVPELGPTPLDERALEAEPVPFDAEATLAQLLECSPEVLAAHAEIRRDEVMVRRERVEPIPNVTLQAVAGHNYEFDLTTAGVQASIPLPIYNRNQGTVREAQSDLARDHAELERVVLSIRDRFADAATRHDRALESVADFRAGTLPMARRAYEVQLASFRERRSAWPQVLVALRTFVALEVDYVDSLLELRRAEVEIRGMLLVDGLAPPEPPTSQGHIESVPTPR